MKFIYENNRTDLQEKVQKSALQGQWHVGDVFTRGDICETLTEEERLKWAPVLRSLAFGEGTAFSGFGERIAEAEDISARLWLATHLLDEGRHAEGFSRLLDYLYPSSQGKHEEVLQNRDVFVFYGHTHRSEDLTSWLLCTQIAEVFGRQCYRDLKESIGGDGVVSNFLGKIINDEHKHISYINSLIQVRKDAMSDETWRTNYEPHVEKMSKLARNMFEAKRRGENFRSFEAMEIDVSAFCDRAQTEIIERFINPKGDKSSEEKAL